MKDKKFEMSTQKKKTKNKTNVNILGKQEEMEKQQKTK